ncbi:MAG: hypothetical protein K0R09_3050 [Clostridiales bacterium]|jgi:hypothetical protein|nr:hypothetical protein [Clostridiales bacterium]
MDGNENYILNNPYYRMEPTNSYIRILHASPDTSLVDVFANDKLIAKNLSYRNFTPYLNIPSGNTNIRVFLAGRKMNPLINTNIFIPAKSIFTIAVADKSSQIGLLALSEPIKTVPSGKALIRFAHLSPGTPNVDIILPNGNKLFTNVAYKSFTDYISVEAGSYTFDIRATATTKSVLTVPNINIKSGNIYTIYAVGLSTGKPSLQALIPLDGNTYLKF